MNANVFRQAHSGLVLTCLLSTILHSASVQHSHRFAFLPVSKGLARLAFSSVDLCRQSRSNLRLSLPALKSWPLRPVHRYWPSFIGRRAGRALFRLL
jgi:hypothetical protein